MCTSNELSFCNFNSPPELHIVTIICFQLDTFGFQWSLAENKNFACVLRQETYSRAPLPHLTSSSYTVPQVQNHKVAVEGQPLFPGSLPDGIDCLLKSLENIWLGSWEYLEHKLYLHWMVGPVRRVIPVGNGISNIAVSNPTPKRLIEKQTYVYLSAHTKIYNLQKAHSLYKISFQVQLLDLRQNLWFINFPFLKSFPKILLRISHPWIYFLFDPFWSWATLLCSTYNLYYLSPISSKSFQFSHRNAEIPFHILIPTHIVLLRFKAFWEIFKEVKY